MLFARSTSFFTSSAHSTMLARPTQSSQSSAASGVGVEGVVEERQVHDRDLQQSDRAIAAHSQRLVNRWWNALDPVGAGVEAVEQLGEARAW